LAQKERVADCPNGRVSPARVLTSSILLFKLIAVEDPIVVSVDLR
jgi:hypothetical protein